MPVRDTLPPWVYAQYGLQVPPPPGGTQPGLGIPESAMPTDVPDDIEMPPEYVGTGPAPAGLAGVAPEAPPVPPQDAGPVTMETTTPQAGTPQGPVVTPEVDAVSGVGPVAQTLPPPQPQRQLPEAHEPTEAELRQGFEEGFNRIFDSAVAPEQQPGGAMSTDELELQGQMAQSQALKMRLAAAKADAMMKAEEARRAAPSLIEAEAETRRITAEKEAELRRYIADVRTGYQQAAEAAKAADAAYPDPDDLLGGVGSWTRALGLAISAAYAGMPAGNLIDQQLRLGQAAAEAKYNKLKAKAEGLTTLASKMAGSIGDIAGGYDAMLDASRQRLADRLKIIANGMAPGKAQAAMLTTAADLLEKNVKDRFDRAKTIADIREKEAQAQKELALAAKAGRGGTGTGSGQLTKTGFFNPWTRQYVAYPEGVKLDGVARREIEAAGENLANMADEIERLNVLFRNSGDAKQSFLGSFTQQWKTENEAKLELSRSRLIGFIAKMAEAGALSKDDKEFYGGQVPSLTKLYGMNPEKAFGVLKQLHESLISDYSNKLRSKGLDPSTIAKTADQNVSQSEKPKAPEEYFRTLAVSPASAKNGAPAAPTEQELTSTIDAGVNRAIELGWTTEQLHESLTTARKNLDNSYTLSKLALAELMKQRDKKPGDHKIQDKVAQVQSQLSAQNLALAHLDNLIKGQAEQLRSAAEKRKQKKEQEDRRIKDLNIRGSSKSGGRQ